MKFDEITTWINKKGETIAIADMNESHMTNALAMLERVRLRLEDELGELVLIDAINEKDGDDYYSLKMLTRHHKARIARIGRFERALRNELKRR